MINTIKSLSVIAVAGWMLSGFNVAHAQIPVTDGASIAQQAAAQVETIAKWKLQYDQMMSQIDQAKQQFESLTGSRGLGTIMNNAALRDYLPNNWQGAGAGCSTCSMMTTRMRSESDSKTKHGKTCGWQGCSGGRSQTHKPYCSGIRTAACVKKRYWAWSLSRA